MLYSKQQPKTTDKRPMTGNQESKNGFGLIEIIVYIALLGMVSVFVSNSLIQIVDTYYRAAVEREVLSNSRLIIETLTKAISSSKEVYAPTSIFNNDTGQLSLITPVNPPAEHNTAYADYYLDNGRLWIRQEGQNAAPLSAASVNITKFRVERIVQGLNNEAVKITLGIKSISSKFTASTTLNSTTALRGNY